MGHADAKIRLSSYTPVAVEDSTVLEEDLARIPEEDIVPEEGHSIYRHTVSLIASRSTFLRSLRCAAMDMKESRGRLTLAEAAEGLRSILGLTSWR